MATATTTGRRPLMDLPTVAKYLGVNERHIRRLVRSGASPSSSGVIRCASTPTRSTPGSTPSACRASHEPADAFTRAR
jgi:hypothetical protein